MLISQAQAATETAVTEAAEAAAAAAGHAAHAVPWYQDTTFFVAVAFVGFFVFFGKKLFGAINTSLDERSQQNQDPIQKAPRPPEETQELLGSYSQSQDTPPT